MAQRWLWGSQITVKKKSSQKYPINVGVPQLLLLHLSHYTLMTFLIMLYLILLSMLMILLSTVSVIRHLICGNNKSSEFESDQHDTVGWARSGFFISMLEKLNWFPFTSLVKLVLLMWKWIGLFLRKNYLLRCWDWLSLLNWIGARTLFLLLKLPPRKLEPWFDLWSFFLMKLLYISINLPYGLAWNTVVRSGLVLLVAT